MSAEVKRTAGVKSSGDDQKSAAAAEKKVIIKSADMKEDLQKEAVEIAIAAFEKQSVEKDVAEQIKKEFDEKYGPTWHCIVGKNFVMRLFMVDNSGNTAPRSINRSSRLLPKASYQDQQLNCLFS